MVISESSGIPVISGKMESVPTKIPPDAQSASFNKAYLLSD